jgi:uncharacterized coiled-coil protein SlyX
VSSNFLSSTQIYFLHLLSLKKYVGSLKKSEDRRRNSKECPNVTAIEVVVKNAKLSPAFADMLQGWDDLLHNLTEFISLKKNNLKEIEHSMIEIQKEITSLRQRMNKLLDRLEAQAFEI